MRHKSIIISLAIVLCALLVAKAIMQHKENTTYPLQLEWSVVHKSQSSLNNPKVSFAVRDRVNNRCDAPLFFLPNGVQLGMNKSDLTKLNLGENAIYLDGNLVPCGLAYKYTDDDLLEAVCVRISPAVCNTAPQTVIKHYGEKRVDITDTYGASEHIWYYPDYYVFLDYDTKYSNKSIYITVATYESKKYWSIEQLAQYGGCIDHDFESKVSSSSSSSSSRTYKYGDSDTYQGSSKQAEDLAAIDAYFGF